MNFLKTFLRADFPFYVSKNLFSLEDTVWLSACYKDAFERSTWYWKHERTKMFENVGMKIRTGSKKTGNLPWWKLDTWSYWSTDSFVAEYQFFFSFSSLMLLHILLHFCLVLLDFLCHRFFYFKFHFQVCTFNFTSPVIVLLFLVKHYTTIQWSRMISECINVKVTTEVGQEGEVCGCVLWSWLWCDPNVAGQPDGKHRARERRENTFMLTHSL